MTLLQFMMGGIRLIVFVSLPVLDRESTFEVFKVVNLLIPYPEIGVTGGVVAGYKLKAENIAFNEARTKFMLLKKL